MKKSVKINIVFNTLKTCTVIIVPLVSYPYVSHILSVNDLGKINFSNSIVSYFALLAALGISPYAIREGAAISEKESRDCFISEMYSINWLFTIISYICIGILFLLWPHMRNYTLIFIIQSLSICFTTLGMEWVNNIDEDFLYITIRTLVIQISSLILTFVFVRDENDYLKYVCISTLAVILAGVMNFVYIRKKHNVKVGIHMHLRKHVMPIFILFLNTVAITIYCNSDSTMLGIFCNDYQVGIYNMSTKVYSIMKSLFSAILVAVLPRLVLYLGENQLKKYKEMLKRTFHIMLITIFPSIIGIFMLSRKIILIIGGEKYLESVAPLQMLSIALIFALVANFISMLVMIPQKLEKVVFNATLIGAIVNIFLNLFVIKRYESIGATVTTLVAEAIVCMILFFKLSDKSIFLFKIKDIVAIIVGVTFEVFWILLICKYVTSAMLSLLIGIPVCIFGYFLILIMMRESIIMEFVSSLQIKIQAKIKEI